jgi:outer membrane protein assembly factor BamB
MTRPAWLILLLFSGAVIPVRSQVQLAEKWRFAAEGWIASSPAIDAAGTVYFGSDDHNIYALNPDGSEKWRYQTGNSVTASPSIDPDGNIYIGSQDSYFYSLKPDGTLNWKRKLGAPISQYGAIGPGPVIYVSADLLYAFNQAGETMWTSQEACNGYSAPVIGHDGTIYTAKSGLSAVSPEGILKWTTPFTGSAMNVEAGCTPAIGQDGTLYVGSKDYHLYAINSDGTVKWSYRTGSWVMTSPVLLADGTICFCSNDYRLYRLSPDGQLLGSDILGAFAPDALCVAKDGLIYASVGRSLMAINASGTVLGQITIHYNESSHPVIGGDGTIYVGTSGGESGGGYQSTSYFFAIASDAGGLAETHWPRSGGDSRNTGCAYDSRSPVARVSKSTILCNADEAVILDGSPSTGLSGRPLSYQWRCTLKPDSASPVVTNADKAVACVTLENAGEYRFQLRVSDGYRPVSIASVTVICGYIEFKISGSAGGSPAIDGSGAIYIGSDSNQLYAFNPDGTEKWRFRTGRNVLTPAIGQDGTVYFGSYDRTFYAVDAEGHEKWRFIGTQGFLDSPAIDAGGVIYVHDGSAMVALNPDGSERWRYLLNSEDYPNSPSIGSDGTVYFSTYGGHIQALSHDGKFKWRSDRSYALNYMTELAVGPGDRLYFTADGRLFAMNPDGTLAWQSPGDQYFRYVHATVDAEGLVYAASYTHFNAILPDGRIQWQYRIGKNEFDGYQSFSAIGADGQIFLLTAFDRKLFMFSREGALNRTFSPIDVYVFTAPAIDGQGRIYFSDGKNLIGVQTTTPALAGAFWPKDRCNNRNTASVHSLFAPRAAVERDTVQVGLNGTAVLSGDLSSDPDGDPLTFLWRCVRHPENSRFTVADSTAGRASVRIEYPGIYTFSLTVQDPDDGTSVAFVTVKAGLNWKRFYPGRQSAGAIDREGSIYFGYANGIAAVRSDGSEKWRVPVGCGEPGPPAIDASGTIYFACGDSVLAFNPSGEKRWGIRTGTIENSSPSIWGDSTIYVGTKYDQNLLAIRADGTVKWRFTAGSWIMSSPAVGTDGTVYIGCIDGKLYAVRPDGTGKWSFSTGNGIRNSPALSADGTIYFGSTDKNFYAVNPDGTEKWHIETPASIYSPPVIGYDETVLFSTSEGDLYALNPGGGVKWTFKLEGYYLTEAPLVGADSTIYISDQNQSVYALTEQGKIRWIYRMDSGVNGPLSMGPDGQLFCSDLSGQMVMIQTASSGLAASSWPKFKHDYRNSGMSGTNPTAVQERTEAGSQPPSFTYLSQNYPNPFNSVTVIPFGLREPGRVILRVIDILGREVARLTDARLEAGEYRLRFDASGLGTGIYFYQLEIPRYRAVRKLVVIE